MVGCQIGRNRVSVWCAQGKTIPVDGNKLCYTLHEPVGVVGQIIPWCVCIHIHAFLCVCSCVRVCVRMCVLHSLGCVLSVCCVLSLVFCMSAQAFACVSAHLRLYTHASISLSASHCLHVQARELPLQCVRRRSTDCRGMNCLRVMISWKWWAALAADCAIIMHTTPTTLFCVYLSICLCVFPSVCVCICASVRAYVCPACVGGCMLVCVLAEFTYVFPLPTLALWLFFF